MTKNALNKEIMVTLVSTIIFAAFIILLVIFIITFVFDEMNNVSQVGDYLVDYKLDQTVEEKFNILDSADGSRLDGYEITITNNGKIQDEYFIYIKPLEDTNIDDLIVSIDNNLINKLGTYSDDGEKFLIYKGAIDPGYSIIHTLRFWWDESVDISIIHKPIKFEYGIIE